MIDAERIPLLVLGGLTVLVGFALLLLDSRRRANRAFCAIATLRGLTFVTAGLFTASLPERTGALFALGPYFLLPIVPLTFYFWLVYPDGRSRAAFRGAGWAVVGISAALAAIYAVDHSTVYAIEPSASGSGFENAAPGWVFSGFGPLSILAAGVPLALATVGMMFAWEYGKNPRGYLQGLLASGFILNGIFDGGLAAAALLEDPSVFGLSGYALAFPVLRALALLPAAIGLGMIIATEREEGHSRRLKIILPAAAALALISGPIPIMMGVSGYGLSWHSLIILSLWRLVMPVTVGYALIRSGMVHDIHLPRLWRRPEPAPQPRDDLRAVKE